MSDVLEKLRPLAVAVDARIRPCHGFDANLLRYASAENREEFVVRRKIKFKLNAETYDLFACLQMFDVTMHCELDAEILSMNASDKIQFTRGTEPLLEIAGSRVYTIRGEVTPFCCRLAGSNEFATMIAALQLSERESLHFYSNAIRLYSEWTSTERVLERCSTLHWIANYIGLLPIEVKRELPNKFVDLGKWVQFAESDDEERSELLAQVATAELTLFVDAVSPRLREIDSYLNDHDDDEAHLLDAMAQAALEAEILLKSRMPSNA